MESQVTRILRIKEETVMVSDALLGTEDIITALVRAAYIDGIVDKPQLEVNTEKFLNRAKMDCGRWDDIPAMMDLIRDENLYPHLKAVEIFAVLDQLQLEAGAYSSVCVFDEYSSVIYRLPFTIPYSQLFIYADNSCDSSPGVKYYPMIFSDDTRRMIVRPPLGRGYSLEAMCQYHKCRIFRCSSLDHQVSKKQRMEELVRKIMSEFTI